MTKYIIYFTDECGFKHCVIKRKSSTVLSEIKDWMRSLLKLPEIMGGGFPPSPALLNSERNYHEHILFTPLP
jgi:hypothetical protein